MSIINLKPFKRQPHKMVKHIQTIRLLLPTNYLSVFNDFVGLALKGLKLFMIKFTALENETEKWSKKFMQIYCVSNKHIFLKYQR